MGKDVIIACDFSSKEETMAFLEKFGQQSAVCEDRNGALLCGRPRYRA